MFGKKREHEPWRDGVYLCTVNDSFQADLLESKLKGEGIPCVKKYEDSLEDAKNIIVPVDLDDCEPIEEN